MKNDRPLRALVARDVHTSDRAHAEIALEIAQALRVRGFDVLEADGADEAWRLACRDPLDVLLAQLGTLESRNVELIRRARRALAPQPGLVAIAGTHDLERAARAAGAHVTLRASISRDLVADTAQRLAAPWVRTAGAR